MSGVLREQARSCLDTLIDHDPAIRLDDPDPEHIHRSRVATRRLRTILREFAPLVTYGPEDQVAYSPDHPAANDPGDVANAAEVWFDTLTGELKWLGGILGSVRDSDVRLQSLEQHCAKLPAADAAAGETLLNAARDERRGRHEELRDAISTGRYLDVLRALDALASGPGARSPVPHELWVLLSEPAATGMPALAHRQWRSVRKAVRRLAPEPSDEALHRVRIETKRLRYLAEVAAPVIRPSTNRDAAVSAAKAATALQDVLGDLHDAVVTEAWLRQTAALTAGPVQAASLIATGLAAGELIAIERETQRKSRAAWLSAWRRLDRKGLAQPGPPTVNNRGGDAIAQIARQHRIAPLSVGSVPHANGDGKWGHGNDQGPELGPGQTGGARFSRRLLRHVIGIVGLRWPFQGHRREKRFGVQLAPARLPQPAKSQPEPRSFLGYDLSL